MLWASISLSASLAGAAPGPAPPPEPVATRQPRRAERARFAAAGSLALGGAALWSTMALQRLSLADLSPCGSVGSPPGPDGRPCVGATAPGQTALRATGLGLVVASGALAGAAFGRLPRARPMQREHRAWAYLVGGHLLAAAVIWMPIVKAGALSDPCATERCEQRVRARRFAMVDTLAVLGAVGAGLITYPLVSKRRSARLALGLGTSAAMLHVQGRF